MFQFLFGVFSWFSALLRSRHDLALEVAALRQQVGVLKRKRPRARLDRFDRFFWLALRQVWSRWADALLIVEPDTVARWHRAGFRFYWRMLCRHRPGRPKLMLELRELIRTIAVENPTWGAPKIHGELLKLGFEVGERTISRYLARLGRRGDPAKLWLTFLKNHREGIAAMDFFTVPTATFRLLYCFFVIRHDRRKILHCNATEHPTSQWVVQQLREAFPEDTAPRYLILDRDKKFGTDVTEMLKAMEIRIKRTAYRSPWQNGIAERWVGSCRRDLLDHVIVLNEAHLRRLVRGYIRYYHEDRTHDGLGKDTPNRRPIEQRKDQKAKLASLPRLGGLHHRYKWNLAA